jgi:hypothetical protein
MRFFNVAGPCDPTMHYMLPPLARIPEAWELVERSSYFVVHAPRQTGKTTALRALARMLTAEGKLAALHFSCEAAEAAGEDIVMAQKSILESIRFQASIDLPQQHRPTTVMENGEAQLLFGSLKSWAESCPKPLVLFFDEIDALRGQSLIAVLRQLRAGYPNRPSSFPACVVLCGLRDVRDYKAASGGDPSHLGTSSPFNIKVESLRLGNFDQQDLQDLYAQHTEETGQPFDPDALEMAWELTRGQPWLVNALAREVIDKMRIAPPTPITATHMEQAKENLILARATHLDSLVARLTEPRVKRVMEPLIAGQVHSGDTYDDDFQYARDLGLVAPDDPVRVSNPIYREVVVRVLSANAQRSFTQVQRTFVMTDGRLDMRRMLEEFAQFWQEHGDILVSGVVYHEVAPQLVLMAFLQRIVNGGGFVDREYGVGRGRIDLCVRWPYETESGRQVQREAMELMVWAPDKPDPLPRGLEQLDEYLERLSLPTGALAIFDRRPDAPPLHERTSLSGEKTPSGRSVTLLRG